MTNLINITSVPAEKLEDGKKQLIVRFKDTDKQPISKENRVRAIILPANIWSNQYSVTSEVGSVARSLSLLLADTIEELARDYLSTIVRDSNWQRTTVNEDAFSLSSLLAWQEERSISQGRLNGDLIKEWVGRSFTITAMKENHSEKHATALGELFVKLAGPNHGITAEKATKLLSTLWNEKDADDSTGLRVMMRLQAISKKKEGDNLLEDLL